MKQKLDAEARAEAIKAEAAKPFARYKCVRLALATLLWASWVVGLPHVCRVFRVLPTAVDGCYEIHATTPCLATNGCSCMHRTLTRV
jgi:hypothetical protein